MTDEHKLAVQLRYLLHLDPTAVYHVVGDSLVIYYDSPHGKPLEPGQACRIILAPDGTRRRIGIVNIDPRVWAPGMHRAFVGCVAVDHDEVDCTHLPPAERCPRCATQ
jgi:hypothetical protein